MSNIKIIFITFVFLLTTIYTLSAEPADSNNKPLKEQKITKAYLKENKSEEE